MPKLEDLELKVKQTTANTQGLKSLASALKGLADSARQLNNSHDDIAKLANAFKQFDPKTANTIKSFATAVKGLKDVSLASSTISIAIGQIGKAFQELTNDVDVEKLERIAYAMNNIKSVAGSSKLLAAAKGAAKNALSVTGSIGTAGEGDSGAVIPAGTAAEITEAGNAASVSSEKLDRLRAILATMGNDAKEDTNSLAEMNRVLNESTPEQVIEAYERLSIALSSGDTKEITKAMANLENVLANMPPEADDAAESVNKLQTALDGLKSFGKSALSRLESGFKSLAKVAGSAVWNRFQTKLKGITSAAGNLFNSFKRIAMYRALRTAIKAITTGFSEGIKHVYQWSQLVGDSFVKSMDSMATSAHYLRDSLGAMASPLIDALAPAIEVLVEHFVNLLNVVNQFIAALTGKDTWRKAVRTPTTYSGAMKEAAENTKKATKAQKELNKALQGFDELNLLTTSEINARKPTSSGAGTTPEVSSTEFETKPIDDWIQAIKDAIDKGDWAGAGTLLAEKLNGMVAEWKAKEFGNKIGEKFQNGLDFYLAFMKKFEWEDLGGKIGQMFNGIFEKMSAEDLGHALVAHIEAGVKLAKGFLKEAKPTFQALGVAVSTAINDLFDPDFAKEFGETIAAGVNDALVFLKTLIVGSEKILQNYDTGETITVKVGGIDFKQVGESLMTSIFTAIKGINWSDLGETVAGLFTGIVDAIGAGITYAAEHISEIAGAIKDFAMAFFKGIWEWFWPSVEEFLFGNHYTAESANDRPNAPVTTGQGAKTPEDVGTTIDDMAKSWQYLVDNGSAYVEVIDKNGSIKTNTKDVSILSDKLDDTDGSFTADFKTKNLQDRLKAVNPYAQLVDDIDGKQTSNFATKNLDDTQKKVKPYSNLLTTIGKKITTTFAVSQYDNVYDKVKALNKQLADTGKAWKITVTADLRLKPHSGSYYTIEPMASGGFPTQGSLFVAGELPGQTEMVGNINGKTGVASGKEITGISDAVYSTGETEAALLQQLLTVGKQLLAKSGNVTLAPNAAAGRWVAQSQAAYSRATGG